MIGDIVRHNVHPSSILIYLHMSNSICTRRHCTCGLDHRQLSVQTLVSEGGAGSSRLTAQRKPPASLRRRGARTEIFTCVAWPRPANRRRLGRDGPPPLVSAHVEASIGDPEGVVAVARRLPPPSTTPWGVHPRSGVGARPPPATGRQSDGYGAPPWRKERTRVGTDPPPGPVAPHRQVLCALLCGVGRGGRTAPQRAGKPPRAGRPVPRPIRAPRWADRRPAATNRVRGRTGDDTSAWACVGARGGGWGASGGR